MQIRIMIVSVVVALCFQVGGTAAEWGNLSGTFVIDGDAPAPAAVTVTKDVEVCSKEKLFDESLVVNPDNKGIANVIVYLYPGRGKEAPQAHPSYAETASANVTLDNVSCRFEPNVCLLRTTQTLVIGNKDPVGHNTKVDTIKNSPINPIVPANSEIKKQFEASEGRPLPVSCNIHPWMKGWLMINDSPYMAVTDKDGKFKIENLPVGEWTFQFYHNKYLKDVKVDGKAASWRKGRTEFTIAAGDNDIGTVSVSADGLK